MKRRQGCGHTALREESEKCSEAQQRQINIQQPEKKKREVGFFFYAVKLMLNLDGTFNCDQRRSSQHAFLLRGQ